MLSTYNFCTIYSYLSHGDLGKCLCVAKEFPGKEYIVMRILAELNNRQKTYIEIKTFLLSFFSRLRNSFDN